MSLTKPLNSKELYSELLSLSQLYLLRTHPTTERHKIDRESFAILKPYISKKKSIRDEINRKTEELLPSKAITSILRTSPGPQPAATAEVTEKPLVSDPMTSGIPASPALTETSEHEVAPKLPISSATNTDKKEKKFFNLEPLDPGQPSPDLSYKNFFKEHFPQHSLCDEIPSDKLARKIKDAGINRDRIQSVVILSFSEQNQSLVFLKNISAAISLCLTTACIIPGNEFEKNGQWDSLLKTPDLRLVIACDYELYLQKNLMQYYRQSEKCNSHYLNQVPLLLLSDLNLYLKRPELKSFLWNAVCNILQR